LNWCSAFAPGSRKHAVAGLKLIHDAWVHPWNDAQLCQIKSRPFTVSTVLLDFDTYQWYCTV
jgi:hypothetical protein